MVLLVLYESIPWAMRAMQSGEVSPTAGGLILWPAKILVPIGFALLLLQGFSELIKRIAFLQGRIPDPIGKARREDRGAGTRRGNPAPARREGLTRGLRAAGGTRPTRGPTA